MSKVLQAKLEQETQDVLAKLKSKNLKSFFVNQAIIAFANTESGKMFLLQDDRVDTPIKQKPVQEKSQTETIEEW